MRLLPLLTPPFLAAKGDRNYFIGSNRGSHVVRENEAGRSAWGGRKIKNLTFGALNYLEVSSVNGL